VVSKKRPQGYIPPKKEIGKEIPAQSKEKDLDVKREKKNPGGKLRKDPVHTSKVKRDPGT